MVLLVQDTWSPQPSIMLKEASQRKGEPVFPDVTFGSDSDGLRLTQAVPRGSKVGPRLVLGQWPS